MEDGLLYLTKIRRMAKKVQKKKTLTLSIMKTKSQRLVMKKAVKVTTVKMKMLRAVTLVVRIVKMKKD